MSILNQLIYKEQQETISLIMMDTDYFKKINDTYGHSVGIYCKDKNETLDTILEQVDYRLYASKNNGRNQVNC